MIAKQLREVMESKNMRQKELAERTGLARSTISQYLSGKSMPTKYAMSKLAEILEVDVNWLSGEKCFNDLLEKQVKLSVIQAAKLMGVSPQFVRIGLQKQQLPFGHAVQMSKNRYTYHISTKKFSEYTGVTFE